jgi:hypothetical protein
MLKKILFVLFLFSSICAGAQGLVYKSNGNIRDSQNNKIAPDEVRVLLAGNEKLLADYNTGRSKKTLGNVLLIGGTALLATDLLVSVYSPQDLDENYVAEKTYPSALTYIGLAAIVISIPVKIGFSRKIKNAVAQYNKNIQSTGSIDKMEFIANNSGVGLRLTLN